MKNTESNIYKDLKTMLEFYQALGIKSLPVDFKYEPVNNFISDKSILLNNLKEEIGDCRRCKLADQRKNVVFGEGDPNAKLMFIGEAPGREEDIQGRPFVGEAGMLLTKLIEKMELKRKDVYIANMIKCRPPMNRDPETDELEICRTNIEKQIEIIRPAVIITLGRIALQSILQNPSLKITKARGIFLEYKAIPLMPTFHPAYLLRNPLQKRQTWKDVQLLLSLLQGQSRSRGKAALHHGKAFQVSVQTQAGR